MINKRLLQVIGTMKGKKREDFDVLVEGYKIAHRLSEGPNLDRCIVWAAKAKERERNIISKLEDEGIYL